MGLKYVQNVEQSDKCLGQAKHSSLCSIFFTGVPCYSSWRIIPVKVARGSLGWFEDKLLRIGSFCFPWETPCFCFSCWGNISTSLWEKNFWSCIFSIPHKGAIPAWAKATVGAQEWGVYNHRSEGPHIWMVLPVKLSFHANSLFSHSLTFSSLTIDSTLIKLQLRKREDLSKDSQTACSTNLFMGGAGLISNPW